VRFCIFTWYESPVPPSQLHDRSSKSLRCFYQRLCSYVCSPLTSFQQGNTCSNITMFINVMRTLNLCWWGMTIVDVQYSPGYPNKLEKLVAGLVLNLCHFWSHQIKGSCACTWLSWNSALVLSKKHCEDWGTSWVCFRQRQLASWYFLVVLFAFCLDTPKECKQECT